MQTIGFLAILLASLLLIPLVVGGPLVWAGNRMRGSPQKPLQVTGQGFLWVGRSLLNSFRT